MTPLNYFVAADVMRWKLREQPRKVNERRIECESGRGQPHSTTSRSPRAPKIAKRLGVPSAAFCRNRTSATGANDGSGEVIETTPPAITFRALILPSPLPLPTDHPNSP